jgi:hypothetical protein
MRQSKSTTAKGGTKKGRAGVGDKRDDHTTTIIKQTSDTFVRSMNFYLEEPELGDLAGRILLTAFPDEQARERATTGTVVTGTVIDAVQELANDVEVWAIHPDIFAVALPVILRAAQTLTRRRSDGAPTIRKALRKLKTAVRNAEKEGA